MKKNHYIMTARVWIFPSETAAWHMLTLPKKESDEINKKFGAKARGWRSLPVAVTLGKTSWKTSIFFDTREGAFILPLKAAIRKKEEILAGDTIRFSLAILV